MILKIITLGLAIPAGFLIAYLSKDELVSGAKYFRVLMILSLIIGTWFYFFDLAYLTLTFAFVFIVSLIGLMKAEKKK